GAQSQDRRPRPFCRRGRPAKRTSRIAEPLSYARALGDGPRRRAAASAAPHQAAEPDRRCGATARARCDRYRGLPGLLLEARSLPAWVGYSHHSLRGAPTLVLASRARAQAFEAPRSHHGAAAVRGFLLRQI